MRDRYFDDFKVGERFESHGVTVTETQILDFALTYDPQPFHLDREAAAASAFGGLIASGFQTLALGFRMFYQGGVMADCGLGSPGLSELRWLAPVRPGDTLRTLTEVKEVRPSRSKPDRGSIEMAFEVRNQHGDAVLTFLATIILARRT